MLAPRLLGPLLGLFFSQRRPPKKGRMINDSDRLYPIPYTSGRPKDVDDLDPAESLTPKAVVACYRPRLAADTQATASESNLGPWNAPPCA